MHVHSSTQQLHTSYQWAHSNGPPGQHLSITPSSMSYERCLQAHKHASDPPYVLASPLRKQQHWQQHHPPAQAPVRREAWTFNRLGFADMQQLTSAARCSMTARDMTSRRGVLPAAWERREAAGKSLREFRSISVSLHPAAVRALRGRGSAQRCEAFSVKVLPSILAIGNHIRIQQMRNA